MEIKCIIFVAIIATFHCCAAKEAFTLDEFLNSKIVNRGWNGTWLSGDTFLYKFDKDYYTYNVKSEKKTIFLNGTVLEKYKSPSIYPSADLKYIIIEHNIINVYRHSKTAQYDMYTYSSKKFEPIGGGKQLQYCKWASNTSTVLYVVDNNIFYLNNPESVSKPNQLSTSGIPGKIYNGVPDWIYEEEVLSSGSALWVSPNGTILIYAEFDDTEVPIFSYVKYGEPGIKTEHYPEVVQIRYPKVNEINPKFKIFYYDLEKNQKKEVIVLNKFQKSENYILNGVSWNDTAFYVFIYADRYQTSAFLKKCDGEQCILIENYPEETNGWFTATLPMYGINSSCSAQIRKKDNFQKLSVFNENTTYVDEEPTDVVKIYGIVDNKVYYGAVLKNAYWQQHVYSFTVPSKKKECITCNFTTPEGPCKYASVQFSADMSHYAKICQGTGPNYVRLETTAPNGGSILWEENEATRLILSKKLLPVVQDVSIPMKGYSIMARLLLPPNIDKKKKYPMIVNVYGGPNSNQISDAFSAGLEKYVVTNMSYIYAYIDGRGSGRRGTDLMFMVYKKLGTLEMEDQIAATQKLQSMYSYIDKTKIGIWGWSYGGFATASVLSKDAIDVFKCGISVAPVTNFQLYDSIYTERYMNAYYKNKGAYEATDLTNIAGRFRGKNFFLIHGNADDNVHYQQSMLLARALELADVPFKQASYPEENHSLNKVSPHLYHSIIQFWKENFEMTTSTNPTTKTPNKNNSANSLFTISSLLICFNLLLVFHN